MPKSTSTHERLSCFFHGGSIKDIPTHSEWRESRCFGELKKGTGYNYPLYFRDWESTCTDPAENQVLRVLHEGTSAIFHVSKLFPWFLCACIKKFHSLVWGFSEIPLTLIPADFMRNKLTEFISNAVELKWKLSVPIIIKTINWCNREGKIAKCFRPPPPFKIN